MITSLSVIPFERPATKLNYATLSQILKNITIFAFSFLPGRNVMGFSFTFCHLRRGKLFPSAISFSFSSSECQKTPRNEVFVSVK